jgi:hypothetical protein
MSYIVADERELSLDTLEAALREIDPAYQITDRHAEPSECGELRHGTDLYGIIQIDQPPVDEVIEEFREAVDDSIGTKKGTALSVLERARAIVVVQVLGQGRDTEATLQKIDPLWDWLFANRKGLLHADGEGFYDRSGLILPTE